MKTGRTKRIFDLIRIYEKIADNSMKSEFCSTILLFKEQGTLKPIFLSTATVKYIHKHLSISDRALDDMQGCVEDYDIAAEKYFKIRKAFDKSLQSINICKNGYYSPAKPVINEDQSDSCKIAINCGICIQKEPGNNLCHPNNIKMIGNVYVGRFIFEKHKTIIADDIYIPKHLSMCKCLALLGEGGKEVSVETLCAESNQLFSHVINKTTEPYVSMSFTTEALLKDDEKLEMKLKYAGIPSVGQDSNGVYKETARCDKTLKSTQIIKSDEDQFGKFNMKIESEEFVISNLPVDIDRSSKNDFREDSSHKMDVSFKIRKEITVASSVTAVQEGKETSGEVLLYKKNSTIESRNIAGELLANKAEDVLFMQIQKKQLFAMDILPLDENAVLKKDKLKVQQFAVRDIHKVYILNHGRDVDTPYDKEMRYNHLIGKFGIKGKQSEVNKIDRLSLDNKATTETRKAYEVPLKDIKPRKVYIDDEPIPFKNQEALRRNYIQANAAAMETIRKFQKEKTFFQKLLGVLSCRLWYGITEENINQVNPKIYDLINHITQLCHHAPHLFRTPCIRENYKTLLNKIRNNEEVDFREFTAVDNVSALKMYIREDLDGLLSVKTTKVIFKSLLKMAAEGEDILIKHGKYFIAKDRLVLLYKILCMFVKISDNFYKTKCRYDELVAILIPYIFPARGIRNVGKRDLWQAGRLICKPYDLFVLRSVLITE